MAQTVSVEQLRRTFIAFTFKSLRTAGLDPAATLRVNDPFRKVVMSFYERASLFCALEAAESLHEEDGETVRLFLAGCLGLQADPEHMEAFWRASRAIKAEIEPEGLLPYLRVAVQREAARLRREQEQKDRQWERLLDRSTPAEACYEKSCGSFPDPEDALICSEWLCVRRDLLAAEYPNLPAVQQRIVDLLLAGWSPAEAVRAVGGNWSAYTALKNRMRRRLSRGRPKKLRPRRLVTGSGEPLESSGTDRGRFDVPTARDRG
jgi:hypothetical protein